MMYDGGDLYRRQQDDHMARYAWFLGVLAVIVAILILRLGNPPIVEPVPSTAAIEGPAVFLGSLPLKYVQRASTT